MPDEIELIGGVEHRVIEIANYNPSWVATFDRERRRISAALGGSAVRIDHVGSTAVAGLAAKPIVDVQISVRDAEEDLAYLPRLEASGYQLRVRSPGHRMLRTPALDVHVHACAVGSAWERQHLLFRDWLRRAPDDRVLYEATKRKLAQRDWPDMNAYADAKGAVIGEITVRAEAWARESRWSVGSSDKSQGG